MSLGSVRIYGVGGFGINTTRPWDLSLPENKELIEATNLPDIKVGYIDTSKTANLRGDERDEDVYVVQGMDGAGKLRIESHKAFTADNSTNQILLNMPPAAMNIVAFSLSGGSGNTEGTNVLMELIKRGERAIGIVVGSSENALTVKNTLDALKTLDGKARSNGMFIPVAYEDNGDNSERAAVDAKVKAIIAAVSVMCGPRITELDTADILNFLRPDRIPGINVKAQLALLQVVTDSSQLSDVADPISIASVISNASETLGGVMPDYSTVGYHPKDGRDYQSYHFVVSVQAIPAIADMVKGKLEDVEKRRAARKDNRSIIDDKDQPTEDGFFM